MRSPIFATSSFNSATIACYFNCSICVSLMAFLLNICTRSVILESRRYFLKGFFGLLARWHIHEDRGGLSTWLHTPSCNRNSGCNSTASCKTLDYSVGVGCCISWAMGECGQGGNPDGVLCHCHIGACTCATVPDAAIGTLTLLCELISSSSTIFTVGCPLIGHSSQGTGEQQSLLHCLTTYTTTASKLTHNLQVS